MKVLWVILFFLSTIWAVELDPISLQQSIKDNPDNINNRFLLAKYYISIDNNKKARLTIDKVLKLEPNSKIAKIMLEHIDARGELNLVLKKHHIRNIDKKKQILKTLNRLYKEQRYDEYLEFYIMILPITDVAQNLTKEEHIKASRIYLREKKFTKAKEVLGFIDKKYETEIDVINLNAQIYYYTKKYDKAIINYKFLYNSTAKKEYALRLLESYYYEGETSKAVSLLKRLKRTYPKNKRVKLIQKGMKKSSQKKFKKLIKEYMQNPNHQSLKNYTIALLDYKKINESLRITRNYIKKFPKDLKSQLMYANYLSANGKSGEALKFLKSILKEKDYSLKLQIGKFLSWEGKFIESEKFLQEVIDGEKDKKLIFEAKKTLAFVYLWQNQKKEAKDRFEKLQKIAPKDKDIKNALLNISNEPHTLIKVYRKRLKNEKNNMALKLDLAKLYQRIGDEKRALYYYEIYYKKYPKNLEVAKELGKIYLKKKNIYKGFGYMEYYSYTTDSPEALLYLAKNYHWNGFNQEALDILNKILRDSPHYHEAKELKAKLLKVAPSYTRGQKKDNTIEKHLSKVARGQLKIAYRLYDNFFYHSSLTYFRNYLQEKPEDYKAREKYAYALEFSGFHKDAAGEFFLMFWKKNRPKLKYHYAYNLMKGGELKKAKKIFLELKDEIYSPAPEFLVAFLSGWKNSWESKKLSKYKNFYANIITKRKKWISQKKYQFKNFKSITVDFYEPMVKKNSQGDYLLKFYQEYTRDNRKYRGYKTLTIKCNGNCKITKEKFQKSGYIKTKGLGVLIDEHLRYIANPPLAQNQKAIDKNRGEFNQIQKEKTENKIFALVSVKQSRVTNFHELLKSND